MSADATEDPCWSLIERAASTAAAGGDMTEIYAEMAANELASSVRACVEASSRVEPGPVDLSQPFAKAAQSNQAPQSTPFGQD